MRADAVFEAVVDRADLELGAFQGAEGALDLFEVLVGAHDLAGGELGVCDAGAQHVDAVEGGLGVDLVGLALEGEAGVGDLDLEVLADLVALERGPTASPIWAAPVSVPRSTRSAISASPRSVACSSSSRLRARSAATSGLRQTTSRSPG